MSWTSRVVDELRQLKQSGVPFDVAWRMALERNPPLGRDLGPREPTLFDVGSRAEWSGDGESNLVEFLRAACDDAWHGRRPVLEHLHVLLDRLDAADEAFAPVATRVHAQNQARAIAVY